MPFVTEADIDRRARTLFGSPWQLADQLEHALTRLARHTGRSEEIELGIEIAALRQRLAAEFAQRNGWRRSGAIFTPAVLARRGVWDGHGRGLNAWTYRLIDHPYFFRTADRRAAALAAHLYDPSPRTRHEIETWSARHGLRPEWPLDYPSWWVPGGTSLCVYRPRAGRDERPLGPSHPGAKLYGKRREQAHG